jgi:hypothetical protein
MASRAATDHLFVPFTDQCRAAGCRGFEALASAGGRSVLRLQQEAERASLAGCRVGRGWGRPRSMLM